MADHPSIPEYFKNKTILLTGVTGFLGKVVLETLLYTCPEIEKVYVLIRAKKGKSPRDRLNHVLSTPLFSKLQENQPNINSKIVAINSDLLEDKLGLSQEDKKIIINDTEVVINAAASINFSESLRNAIKVNLVSVDEVIKLCKEMSKLEVLCHVSTAFSNCKRNGVVYEKVYPVHIDPRFLMDLIKWMPSHVVDKISTTLRKDFFNNYVFTKQSAEYLVQEECTDFPSCIFRPPMLCPAMEGRVPGWIDSYFGVIGLSVLGSTGVMRIMPLSEDMRITFCPVDHAANALIASTWKTALERKNRVMVFNFAENTLRIGDWTKIFYQSAEANPPKRILRAPCIYLVSNKWMFHFWSIVYHWIPALIIDGICVITGYPPCGLMTSLNVNSFMSIFANNLTDTCKIKEKESGRQLISLYKRYHRTINDFVPFNLCKLEWKHENLQNVVNSMSEEDRKTFSWTFDISQIDEFGLHWSRGVIKYLFKDDLKDIDKNRQKHKIARIIGWIIWSFVCLSLIYLVVSILKPWIG